MMFFLNLKFSSKYLTMMNEHLTISYHKQETHQVRVWKFLGEDPHGALKCFCNDCCDGTNTNENRGQFRF